MSMLFRFKDAQAAELGLAQKTDRRPRIASTCKDLRHCERWRGEILKDVSRKVSKIQDFGLTDYEVRDLNDEINRLLREKYHWEAQIIALGGANYRRAAPKTTDSEGKEVPGMRGYKYFGRAKELPGVKELFDTAGKEAAELDPDKIAKYDPFANPAPGYFGDLDDERGHLSVYEKDAEKSGWNEAARRMGHLLGTSVSTSAPIAQKISLRFPTGTLDLETVLDGLDLQAPRLISEKEVEGYITEIEKAALLAEYL